MREGTLAAFRRKGLAAALVLVMTGGCGEPPDAGPARSAPKHHIGLAICMTPDTPFFVTLVSGAREAAERLGADLTVRYAGEDPGVQARQVRELADMGVDLVLLNPVNESLAPAVEELAVEDVPVFTVDRGVDSEHVVCHIASDNRAGGRMAGDYLAEALHRQGRVVEIRGTPGSSAARDRGIGFDNAMAEHPAVEVVGVAAADFTADSAAAVFQRVLLEQSEVDGVFAHNDDMALGAMEAAWEMGREDILFVGFDAVDEAIEAVDRGDMLATVAQKPAEMGRIGVETAVRYLSGERVPDSIVVELALIIR